MHIVILYPVGYLQQSTGHIWNAGILFVWCHVPWDAGTFGRRSGCLRNRMECLDEQRDNEWLVKLEKFPNELSGHDSALQLFQFLYAKYCCLQWKGGYTSVLLWAVHAVVPELQQKCRLVFNSAEALFNTDGNFPGTDCTVPPSTRTEGGSLSLEGV